MASPQILVTGQVPEDSEAEALAGRDFFAPVETIDQMVARIAEARKVGAQPAVQIIYRESRWNRVVPPAAVSTVLPAIVATIADLTGHDTTSKVALLVAALLASLAGFALVKDRVEWSR
jgi:hypothetical protein